MFTATKALAKISSKYKGRSKKNDKVDEDRNLVEMIYTMLQSTCDGMTKATLRLELQQ